MAEKFIQKAIKHPGRLRAAAKRMGCMGAEGKVTAAVARCVKSKTDDPSLKRAANLAVTLGKLRPSQDGAVIIESAEDGAELPLQALVDATAVLTKPERVSALTVLSDEFPEEFASGGIVITPEDALALSFARAYAES